MGSFSWLKADNLTKYGNIYEGCLFKCLIPKEFGGGFIKDRYQDYGFLGRKDDGSPKYDMYELLSIWNADALEPFSRNIVKDELIGVDFDNPLKEIDENTSFNRGLLGFRSRNLKYPLKLVSASYKGTYEDCEGISIEDPEQGSKRTREYYDKWYNCEKANGVITEINGYSAEYIEKYLT